MHAGIRPGRAIDDQDPEDLIWIREPFLHSNEDFGCIVVHGHTPAMHPEVRSNRINIDTGAVFTGRLTCLVLEGRRRFCRPYGIARSSLLTAGHPAKRVEDMSRSSSPAAPAISAAIAARRSPRPGFEPVVFDNLRHGPSRGGALGPLIEGDMRDADAL